MLKKYQQLGKTLSKEEMKTVTGGIIWPYLRQFTCTIQSPGFLGCTDNSSYGVSCCRNFSPSSSPIWGDPGCPYQTCPA